MAYLSKYLHLNGAFFFLTNVLSALRFNHPLTTERHCGARVQETRATPGGPSSHFTTKQHAFSLFSKTSLSFSLVLTLHLTIIIHSKYLLNILLFHVCISHLCSNLKKKFPMFKGLLITIIYHLLHTRPLWRVAVNVTASIRPGNLFRICQDF